MLKADTSTRIGQGCIAESSVTCELCMSPVETYIFAAPSRVGEISCTVVPSIACPYMVKISVEDAISEYKSLTAISIVAAGLPTAWIITEQCQVSVSIACYKSIAACAITGRTNSTRRKIRIIS